MSDIFGQFQSVSSKSKRADFDDISAYEEHYMKLLKKYLPEIQQIEEMMQGLRAEREKFYTQTFPAVKQSMDEDNVLSEECKAQWLQELQENMETSFRISESLIQHYVTKNLEEFKQALKETANKV